MERLKALLLSGYSAASHQYWCTQLSTGLPEFDWHTVSLPDRHFYWRIRSNALTFALEHRNVLQHDFDIVVATSMVDLCNLRGLMPHLSQVPAVYYFHENQFAYPERKPAQRQSTGKEQKTNSNLINAQLTTLYSALSAQHLVFNSEYNRDSFFTGVKALAAKMPDGLPAGFLQQSIKSSSVIPVPVVGVEDGGQSAFNSGDAIEIVWNHRWEYDKQPQVFFAAIEKLLNSGVDCKMHVMGQSFREVPDCFDEFKSRYGQQILTWGYQPPDTYTQVLKQAHIVVSSALHDFQGLGMQEAIMAGCLPVAPRRMAYPEYIPEALLYNPASGEDAGCGSNTPEQHEVDALADKLCSVIASSFSTSRAATTSPFIELERYRLASVLPAYKACFADLLAGRN